MLGRQDPYLIPLKNINSKDFYLVGREAVETAELLAEGVPTPETIVLTVKAFDDFITATDLIEPISKLLSQVKPHSKTSAVEASDKITELIYDAPIPAGLERQILEAYRKIGSHDLPFVTLQASNFLDERLIPQEEHHHIALNVRGDREVIFNIKTAWLSLFSPGAIKLRANESYSGQLSQGIIIQKMLRPEVSGKTFTLSTATLEDNIIETHVIFGLDDQKQANAISPDIYKVDKKTLNIIEKNIVQQDFMIVRRGKVIPGVDPNIKVTISSEWNRVQKIDDTRIKKLAELGLIVERIFKGPVELNWGIEAGDVYVFAAYKLEIEEEHDEPIENMIDLENLPSSEIELIPDEPEPDYDLLKREVEALLSGENIEILTKDDLPSVEIPPQIPSENLSIDEPISKPDEEYRLVSNILLDISKLNGTAVNNAQKFKGVFMNGTELVLSYSILPEEIKDNALLTSELTERFMSNITTGAKIADGKPMIYQFSNITENEYKLLAIKSTGRLSGDERFLEHPEALTFEAMCVKKARNTHKFRNINVALPSVRSYENLTQLKKVISAQGLRRTASLKLYAELAIPSFVFDLQKLQKNDVDGIIVNYDTFLRLSINRDSIHDSDHKTITEQIKTIINELRAKELSVLIAFSIREVKEFVLQELLLLNADGLIFREMPHPDFMEYIKDFEQDNTDKIRTKKKKRGRKQKKLY